MVASSNCVAVHVADNGAAVSTELQPHLFALFVQGERSMDRSQGGLAAWASVFRWSEAC
jgi:nitrogen-specific signal transduction histidine kinase